MVCIYIVCIKVYKLCTLAVVPVKMDLPELLYYISHTYICMCTVAINMLCAVYHTFSTECVAFELIEQIVCRLC